MRTILLVSLLLCLSGTLAISRDQAVEVLAGVMSGVIKKDNLKEMQKCVQDADELA